MRYEDSMKGVAAQIIKEQQRVSKIKNNPEEFHWHDEYATLNFFRFICKNIGNLGNGEIEKMVTRLKSIDQKAVENHVNGAVWAFDYDKMFCVLMENEICRKVCEKNKYNSWMNLIGNYCFQGGGVIMNKKDLKVIDQVLQKDYKNLQGRSAILDCVARDSEGKQMDVEIQQDNEGASPKRARYHSGLMDMNTLNPGQDFDDLPESYVIFITRDDALGYGLPIYHIDRKIEEVSENFKDEAHIIYVNSKKQEDTELGRLMHDLHCKNAEDMHSKILADRVYELKETQKGVEFMCREMEQIYSEGIESGELKKAKASALSMAADGMKVDKIAHYLNVSVQMVQKWIDESMSVAH